MNTSKIKQTLKAGFRHVDPQSHFTKVPNSLLRDARLTPQTTWLICYLVSHRPDFRITADRILRQKTTTYLQNQEPGEALKPMSRDRLRSMTREAEEAGYMVKVRLNSDGGKFDWDYLTFSDPEICDRWKEKHLTETAIAGIAPDGYAPSLDLYFYADPRAIQRADDQNTNADSELDRQIAFLRSHLQKLEQAKSDRDYSSRIATPDDLDPGDNLEEDDPELDIPPEELGFDALRHGDTSATSGDSTTSGLTMSGFSPHGPHIYIDLEDQNLKDQQEKEKRDFYFSNFGGFGGDDSRSQFANSQFANSRLPNSLDSLDCDPDLVGRSPARTEIKEAASESGNALACLKGDKPALESQIEGAGGTNAPTNSRGKAAIAKRKEKSPAVIKLMHALQSSAGIEPGSPIAPTDREIQHILEAKSSATQKRRSEAIVAKLRDRLQKKAKAKSRSLSSDRLEYFRLKYNNGRPKTSQWCECHTVTKFAEKSLKSLLDRYGFEAVDAFFDDALWWLVTNHENPKINESAHWWRFEVAIQNFDRFVDRHLIKLAEFGRNSKNASAHIPKEVGDAINQQSEKDKAAAAIREYLGEYA
jgi:hypothetical protein